MNFEPTEDQARFISFLGQMTSKYRDGWTPNPDQRFAYSKQLDEELTNSGYFTAATEQSLGLLSAASMIYELAKLPTCVEATASSIISPMLLPNLERPLAMIWNSVGRPTRFLPVAKTMLFVDDNDIRSATVTDGQVETLESLFGFPIGRLCKPEDVKWTMHDNIPIAGLKTLWQIGIAAEIAGALCAGIESVVEYVSERRQFGRPLGAFQGMQHRLADDASRVQAARWMMLRAAESRTATDAGLALGYAQSIATKICYDLHQFMGAMGLTLEHPLHRWTYRVKLLRSDLGGAARVLAETAQTIWASPHIV